MKYPMWATFIVLILVVVFTCCEVQAVGFGPYATLSTGTYRGRIDNRGVSVGAGVMLDAAVVKDQFLNYRMKVGYETWADDRDSMDTVVWRNALGFGLLRKESLRLWLGPELSLSYTTGTISGDHDDADLIGFGIGPLVGANIEFANGCCLAPEIGVRYTQYSVDREHRYGSGDQDDDFGMLSVSLAVSVLF